MDISLSDFRNVLGVKNDGNVVMTLDKRGVEKADYGNLLSNMFRKVRSTPSDPEENKAVRRALARAIENSAEGKVLSAEDMGRIRGALGLDGDAEDALARPLSRLELKAIIDIVDQAAANDSLIERNIGKLADAELLDNNVSKGVRKAMDNAACLNPPESNKERLAATKALFGKDFLGRSPAEVDKFVRRNIAVIRDQLFDKLYWENPSLTNFADMQDFDVNIPDENDDTIVKVKESVVTEAFKEVVGKLMVKFAAREPVLTRFETLLPTETEVDIDPNGTELWLSKMIGGGEIESAVADAFMPEGLNLSVFESLQLCNATEAVTNMVRRTFNELLVENKFNSQDTEKAFKKKFSQLKSMLEEIAKDFKEIGPEATAKLLAKAAKILGMLVPVYNLAENPKGLSDAALTALNMATSSVSTRHVVEDFVNEKFAYVENREPMVNFFMDSIHGKEGGITAEQRKLLANYQRAALDGAVNDVVRNELETLLIDPLAAAYSQKLAKEDPKAIEAARKTRNDTAFASLVKTVKGYDKMDDFQKEKALAEMKLQTVIAKIGYEEAYEIGASSKPSSESVKVIKVDGVEKLDPKAIEAIDKQLLALDDKEFEFYSQYNAKGMRAVDNDMSLAESMYKIKIGRLFENALKDGTISISSIPKAAVPLLSAAVDAHLETVRKMNEGDDADLIRLSIRSVLGKGLTRKDPINEALFNRLQSRIAATGVKNLPPCCKALAKTDDPDTPSIRIDEMGRRFGIASFRGFGTLDIGRIIKLMTDMGIDLTPLEKNDINAKVELLEKILCLSTLAAMSGFKLDGLAEFTERVVGKPFSQVNYTDFLKVLVKNKLMTSGGIYNEIKIPDPLDKLSGNSLTAKEFFAGQMSLSKAGLAPAETNNLLAAARDLANAAPGTVKKAAVTVKGVSVELTRLKGGELSVKIGNLPMRAAFDAHGLVRQLENEITANPGNFSPEVVKSTLPTMETVESGQVPLVRARELYAKTAAAKTGLLPVQFSSLSTVELRKVAIDAVDGKFTAENLPKDPSANYNSGAMLEMHANLSLTSGAEIDAKVKIASPEKPSYVLRCSVPPTAQTVSNIVADLFLNQDTWAFDGGKTPGERIRKLVMENAPELEFIKKSMKDGADGLLSSLAPEVREAVKDIFADIAKLEFADIENASLVSSATRNTLAAIEAKIDAAAKTLVDAMQAKVTQLFAPKQGADVAKPNWQKTFAEFAGKEGIDTSTTQGKFTMKVLQNYFANSAAVDKRAMLSAFIRNTDNKSSDAKQVAELLKGAGPLLQKMLQGLPLSSFNAETQLALKDMKSRLLPIPDEAVKAQMLELVNSSNGNILSIEVKKSLGAATVGQAFLCTIRTKDHPYAGVECVVKLLRPNVDTAIQREKAMIDKLIADDPAMKATFDGQYRKILEEFDLTLESTNVGIGESIYEMPDGVASIHSMQLLEGTTSTMTSMIVKKAEGSTFDATIDRLRGEAEQVLDSIKHTTEVEGKTKSVYKAASPVDMYVARRQLLAKAAQLKDRRNHILDVTKAWFENALFKNGFFHGDLHGGNLMTGTEGTTFIDFGNCSRLSKDEQDAIKMMLATIVSGDVDHVISNFRKLLPADAQAAFNEAFKPDSQGYANLTEVLRRGTAYDLMPRLQAFLAVVQGANVQIPASIQNFVQSYMRLADIVTDIDRTVEDLHIAASSIYCDMPDLAPVEGEPRIFTEIKKIVSANTGNADTPYSSDAVNQAAKDAMTYVNSNEGKEEIKALSHDFAKIQTVLKPFCEKMHTNVRIAGNGTLNPTAATFARSSGFNNISYAILQLENLQKEGKIPSEAANKLFDNIEKELSGVPDGVSREFQNDMSLEKEKNNFEGVAEARDLSMTDVCCLVIKNQQDDLGKAALAEFTILGVVPFGNRLLREFENAAQAATRKKNVGPAIRKLNDALPIGQRLSGRDLSTLLRATDTFYVPSPRPDTEKNWATDNVKSMELLEAISHNLKRGAEALNVPSLTDEATRHAALNFALADGTLAKSIIDLTQEDYAKLLLVAGQLDLENGNHLLTTALGAIRDSQVMLDEVSQSAEPDEVQSEDSDE